MAVNKVVYNAKVLIDLTSDTITADKLANGVTAHDKSGTKITGTLPVDELVNGEDYLATVMNKQCTELVNSKIKEIPSNFQKGNTKLTKVVLDICTNIGESSFNGCTNVTEVKLPALTALGAGVFEKVNKVTSFYFPNLTTMNSWGYTFNQCSGATRMYFPKLTNKIGSHDFDNCNQMTTLILGASSVCTLGSTNAFTKTPIALYNNKVGYVYVPRALVDSYKSETNWSAYAAQIRAIEDYPSVLEGWE